MPDDTPNPTPTETPTAPPEQHGSHGDAGLGLLWLLTNETDGRWCVLFAESHPSIERQQIKCFASLGIAWVADNAPCAGFVSESDVWTCDKISYEWREARWPDAPWLYEGLGRLPLAQLMIVYQAHLDKWGDDHQ